MKPLILIQQSAPNTTLLVPLNSDLASVAWSKNARGVVEFRLQAAFGPVLLSDSGASAAALMEQVCIHYDIDLGELKPPIPEDKPQASTPKVQLSSVSKTKRKAVVRQLRRDGASAEDTSLLNGMEAALGSVAAPEMGRKVSPKALPAKYKGKTAKLLASDTASYDDPEAQGTTTRYWRCDCGDSSYIPARIHNCPRCSATAESKPKPISYYTLLRAGVISFSMARNQHSRDKK